MLTVIPNKHSNRPQAIYNKPNPTFCPDRIGIVGYHDHAFVIAKPTEATSPWLLERSQQLHRKISGCTNMTDGLRLSIQLLKKVPRGIHRRIWLLSDGHPNIEQGALDSVVKNAFNNYININTIGFGERSNYDESLLRRIASSTHNGQFMPVTTLQQLSDVLVHNRQQQNRKRRSETTILAIDCSYSMNESMGDRSKIAVVEEAVLHLIHYKQRCFS